MNFNSPCFGSFGDPKQINYCAPLQQLINEHPSLLEKMADFNQIVLEHENKSEENWNKVIEILYDKLTIFIKELEPHSDREENILFEMLVPYIGRETGPIAQMEYEHDLAKKNLKQFIEKTELLNSQQKEMNKQEASELFEHLKTVYTTLTDHFMKEENILFPLAEQTLTDDEKQELEQKFKKS